MAVFLSLFLIWILSIILLFVDPRNQVNRRVSFIAILIIPMALFGWLYHSYRPVSGIYLSQPVNFIVIILLLILYSIFLITHGFLGIKLWPERKYMVNGSDLLRHALKNELAKISLCSRNILASGYKFDLDAFQKYIGGNARNIQVSTDHLFKIIERINDFTGEIALVKNYNKLSDIVEDAINLAVMDLQARNITLTRQYLAANMDFFCIVMRST